MVLRIIMMHAAELSVKETMSRNVALLALDDVQRKTSEAGFLVA
jgi:hypothetical protein